MPKSSFDKSEAAVAKGYCLAIIDAVADWGLEPDHARSMLADHQNQLKMSDLDGLGLNDFERGFMTALLSGEKPW